MSMLQEREIKCQGCGTTQNFTLWDSLNVTLNPEEKPKLLKGDLNQFTCEQCGWSASVVYPMVYHDMKKHFMVWLLPDGGEPDPQVMPPVGTIQDYFKDYRFRVVSSNNQLQEKVRIYDHDFDDRMVEILKIVLKVHNTAQQLDGELLFAGVENASEAQATMEFVHLKDEASSTCCVPVAAYRELVPLFATKLASLPSGVPTWLRVNQEYATTLLKSFEPE